ncbi:MAG: dihydrofolate reductase family protein [Candidatus Peregrinibacteria bacterium]
MKRTIYLATSLDGYIAKKDGDIAWLNDFPNPEKSDFGFSEFLATQDAIVMGHKTFETVVSFKDWIYPIPVFILSTSLTSIPQDLQEKNIQILQCSPEEVLAKLKEREYENVYIDGGQTIQQFLKRDLIDEMIITKVPLLLGAGIPLFSELSLPLPFEHLITKVFSNGLVKSHYQRIR